MQASKRILITTMPEDVHAYAVAACLTRRGAHVDLIYSEDFPETANISFKTSASSNLPASYTFKSGANALDLSRYDVVWWRRFPGFPVPKYLHPDDRDMVRDELFFVSQTFADLVAPDAFWVNPFPTAMRAANKALQLNIAANVGLTIPNTIITNSRDEALQFIDGCERAGRRTVFKTVLPHHWHDKKEDGGKVMYAYTTFITQAEVASEAQFKACPSILQEHCEKSYEVRATFMGTAHAAVAYNFSDSATHALDSRVVMIEDNSASRHTLPDHVAHQCQQLMAKLGIVFGCFDFIVTPEGQYIFLEVNSVGQWLWKEDACPEIALLDGFCDFLLGEPIEAGRFIRSDSNIKWTDLIDSPEYRAFAAEGDRRSVKLSP
jgi:glutathione synthase/RimK-type ligase-like ATP-grasp enzyme